MGWVPGAERVRRWLADLNRRPFGRPEAAFYEFVGAPAVREIVRPVLLEALRGEVVGALLDVGCGGGTLTHDLVDVAGHVVGVDASPVQLGRFQRVTGRVAGAVATAERLPFADGSFDAVVSSCAVKHWPDAQRGLDECARVIRPGGRLVLVEIDGGEHPDDLLRFAARARIPAFLQRFYPALANRTFVPISPPAGDLAAAARRAGFGQVRHRRLDGLPFVVVEARRPPAAAEPEGGDPVCWLDQVCPECGALVEGDLAACAHERLG